MAEHKEESVAESVMDKISDKFHGGGGSSSSSSDSHDEKKGSSSSAAGGNNNDVRITVDQSTESEPEDVPLLARKLVPALLTVGIATMGVDISTVLYKLASGVVFGHNKLAYFLVLASIFAAGATEVMTAFWLACSSAPDGCRRHFSFARAAICASIVLFVAVVGINNTVVI